MSSILVRNVPDSLHTALSQMASDHRRSLRQEVIVILEQAARAWLDHTAAGQGAPPQVPSPAGQPPFIAPTPRR